MSLPSTATALALALAALAVPAHLSAQATSPYHRAPRDTVSQQVYDGWKQYELNCARCHGEYAAGTSFAPNLSVSLKDDGPVNTKAAFVETVCKGRPDRGMPAWCPLGLDNAKIEAIYAYVRGRATGALAPGRPAVNPDLPPGVPKAKGDGTRVPKREPKADAPTTSRKNE